MSSRNIPQNFDYILGSFFCQKHFRCIKLCLKTQCPVIFNFKNSEKAGAIHNQGRIQNFFGSAVF